MISRVEPILLSQGESSLRKQNAVLIIAIAIVVPSVALAHKKISSDEHFHFSYSETHWAHAQEHSPPVQQASQFLGIGKSAGYK